jgi:hypothetical protein
VAEITLIEVGIEGEKVKGRRRG